MQRQVAMQKSFSGPIPAPEDLFRYEEIHPGLADRIMKMAENQSSHRHQIESQVVVSNIRNEKTGQWMAFFLTAMLMIFGFYLIAVDANHINGYLVAFAPVVFHAGNYIWQKREEQKTKDDNQ